MDQYPTRQDLDLVKKYGGTWATGGPPINIPNLLDCLKNIWWHSEYLMAHEENTLELHTGGWSGNEDIIETLKQTVFWDIYWLKSVRGGHHYFEW